MRRQRNCRLLKQKIVAHFLQRPFHKAANVPVWIEKGNDLLERCKLVNVSEKGARLTISDDPKFDLSDEGNHRPSDEMQRPKGTPTADHLS
jgi:hypothetical protein